MGATQRRQRPATIGTLAPQYATMHQLLAARSAPASSSAIVKRAPLSAVSATEKNRAPEDGMALLTSLKKTTPMPNRWADRDAAVDSCEMPLLTWTPRNAPAGQRVPVAENAATTSC